MENRVEEYVKEIRAIGGLKNAILCGITLSKREKSAEFFLVTDKAYTSMDEERAKIVTQAYLPQGFTAALKIVKRVPDAQILKRKIYDFVRERFIALRHCRLRD